MSLEPRNFGFVLKEKLKFYIFIISLGVVYLFCSQETLALKCTFGYMLTALYCYAVNWGLDCLQWSYDHYDLELSADLGTLFPRHFTSKKDNFLTPLPSRPSSFLPLILVFWKVTTAKEEVQTGWSGISWSPQSSLRAAPGLWRGAWSASFSCGVSPSPLYAGPPHASSLFTYSKHLIKQTCLSFNLPKLHASIT